MRIQVQIAFFFEPPMLSPLHWTSSLLAIPFKSIRFTDGHIARSIGTAEVALPSTDISLPAHVFADDTLRQSLFGISDIITNKDYDATFRKDGLYLYHGNDLIHFTPKSLDDSSWTLPIQSPLLAHANAALRQTICSIRLYFIWQPSSIYIIACTTTRLPFHYATLHVCVTVEASAQLARICYRSFGSSPGLYILSACSLRSISTPGYEERVRSLVPGGTNVWCGIMGTTLFP